MLELNKIYNVDCIEGMKYIDDGFVDMIFCDLPYGITKNKWDCMINLESLWQHYNRIIKSNGAIVLFGSGMFTAKMMVFAEKIHRYNLIWEKSTPTGFLNANRMPLRSHEDIMIFYKKLPTYNPIKTIGYERKISKKEHHKRSFTSENYGQYECVSYDSSERYPKSVLKFATDKQKCYLHPTQKPLELCRFIIKMFTNPEDIVLDNCCGSGSIPLAAYMENRRFIGMDNGICTNIKSKYFGKTWEEISTMRIKNTNIKNNLK